MEIIRPVLVGEGQFALIAPDRDLMGVNLLMADKMLQDFVLCMRDEESGIGLLAKLNHPNEVTQMQELVTPLKRLGARRVEIVTRGMKEIRVWPGRFALGMVFIYGRTFAMDELVRKLTAEGISVNGDNFQDLEYSNRALFSLEQGLYIPESESEFESYINDEIVLREDLHNRELLAAGLRKDPDLFKISCAHWPLLLQ